jgi:hypothetical protein
MMTRRLPSLLLIPLLLALFVSGCSNQAGGNEEHAYRLAPLAQMPDAVQEAPATVREAYQFAVYNQDVLSQLPCYCGCGAMGHTSNYSCFVAGVDENGVVEYDNHALGCSICVDIAQDAMRLVDEGKSTEEIYETVDATYSRFGPPTPLQEALDGE